MEFLYTSIIIAAFLMEISKKINTVNIIKKISLALMIVGGFINLAGRENCLIELGLLCYLSVEIFVCYFCRHKRKCDHANS